MAALVWSVRPLKENFNSRPDRFSMNDGIGAALRHRLGRSLLLVRGAREIHIVTNPAFFNGNGKVQCATVHGDQKVGTAGTATIFGIIFGWLSVGAVTVLAWTTESGSTRQRIGKLVPQVAHL
ncbi:hypothetical protein CONPUDRAFT_77733 [Coniophora puteana RWD-64-598 SS2]|uniref:Uncharacterized protein n=1 Tax=Coniophora puteana (strain RWD-64-598) TaxID=741705 RepID=A0A5M3M827_CONPW|nr:uncharacterized protein CONPUDRAFT_77733 [Coniophora puteana RWD-64-598 SS2]EIW74945.1 hypothetical protein CONPUDRAFT_77733 [Coniophora puteana RWD-64-598 SS2]